MRKMKLFPVKPNILRKRASGITQARVGQKRSGYSLSTSEILQFNLDHALARDAIHAHWNYEKMIETVKEQEIQTFFVKTKALERKEYLLNPHLGTKISENDAEILKNQFSQKNQTFDIALIVTDGLSSCAIEQHFIPFLNTLYPKLKSTNFKVAPIVFAPYGRVALSDEIGALLRAKIAIIIVGERPGLSAVDSMGIYLTHNPKIGKQNSDRNCISNVRPPFGLCYEDAANQLLGLIEQSLKVEFSGAKLKLQ